MVLLSGFFVQILSDFLIKNHSFFAENANALIAQEASV